MSALFLRCNTAVSRLQSHHRGRVPVFGGSRTAANDWHLAVDGLALSGAEYIEATHVEAIGHITPGCLGLWDEATEAALRPIVASVRTAFENSRRDAARPCRPQGVEPYAVGWRPADSLAEGGWQTEGPSALPQAGRTGLRARGGARSHPRYAFVSAREEPAEPLGLDALELHCARGYLLHQFSPRRSPTSAGINMAVRCKNRLRFPLEVFEAVRAGVSDARPSASRCPRPTGSRVAGTGADHQLPTLKQRGVDWVDSW